MHTQKAKALQLTGALNMQHHCHHITKLWFGLCDSLGKANWRPDSNETCGNEMQYKITVTGKGKGATIAGENDNFNNLSHTLQAAITRYFTLLPQPPYWTVCPF